MTVKVGQVLTTAHLAITFSLGPGQFLESLKRPLEHLDAVLMYELRLQATRRLVERVEEILVRKESTSSLSAALRSGLPAVGSMDMGEAQNRNEEEIETLTQALLSASRLTPDRSRVVLLRHLALTSGLAVLQPNERRSVTVESQRYNNPWEVVLVGVAIGSYAVRGLAWTLRAWQEHQLRQQQIEVGRAKLDDRDLDRQLKIEELRACRLENERREHELQKHRDGPIPPQRGGPGIEARQIAAAARTSELGPVAEAFGPSDQEQAAANALRSMSPIVEVTEVE